MLSKKCNDLIIFFSNIITLFVNYFIYIIYMNTFLKPPNNIFLEDIVKRCFKYTLNK